MPKAISCGFEHVTLKELVEKSHLHQGTHFELPFYGLCSPTS